MDTDDLMAEELTADDVEQLATTIKRGEFIRGPFDWDRFCAAARLGHASLVIWQLIHHFARMRKKPAVILPNGLLATCFGISRAAKSRTLGKLERKGLVMVDRSKGRSVRVSLREPP